jgi:phage terminase large subunit
MPSDSPITVLGSRLARRYRNDPVAFAVEVLQVTAWSRFVEMLRAVRDNDSVAFRAGQKVSKTLALACLILWWVCTRRRAKVIFCAPSGIQAQDGLYAELVRLHAGGKTIEERKRDGGALIELGGVALKSCEDGIRWDDGRAVFGFSAADTKKTEKYLGHSGPEMMFVADEASGIDEKILEAIDGNRAGGGKILAGNPTRNTGSSIDAFHAGGVASGAGSMHLERGEPERHREGPHIPGLARRDYIEKRAKEWGAIPGSTRSRSSASSRSRTSARSSRSRLLEAQKRWMDRNPSAQDLAQPLRVGVDPARFGQGQDVDRVPREATGPASLETREKLDNVEVAGVLAMIERATLARASTSTEGRPDQQQRRRRHSEASRARRLTLESSRSCRKTRARPSGFNRRAQVWGR